MLFTEVDVAVLVTVSICMLVSFLLGGARTVTGIGKWVATVLITLLFYPEAMKYAEGKFSNPLMGNVAVVVILFTCALIFCTLFAIGVMTVLGGFKGTFTDRLFGLLVGFALSALLVSAGHFFAVFSNDGKVPDWLKNSETSKYTAQGAEYFDKLVNDFPLFKDATVKLKAEQERLAKEAAEKASIIDENETKALEALDAFGTVVNEEEVQAGEIDPAGGTTESWPQQGDIIQQPDAPYDAGVSQPEE